MAAREIAVIIKAKDAASPVFRGISGSLGKLGQVAKIATVGAVAGIAALGAGITKLAMDAAPLADIEKSYHKLAASYDLDSEKMLAAMTKASKGTVAQSDLLAAANKALIGSGQELGKEFGEALPKLMEIARASAKATGEDVDFLFQSLVTGIKRSSPMIIDNTGLQLKLGEAQEKYAASLGISVKEMSGEQKQIALLMATMDAGKDMVEALGEEELTTAEHMAVFRAQTKNLKDELGKAFLPVLTTVLKTLTPFVAALAKKAVPAVQKLTKAFERGAKRMVKIIKPWAKTLQSLVLGFQDLWHGFTDAGIEQIGDTIWEAFGPRVGSAVYTFMDVVRGLAQGLQIFREGNIAAAIEQIGDTIWEAFGERAGRIVYSFLERLHLLGSAGARIWATLKGGFDAVVTGLQEWWTSAGGVAGILKTIREGWQTRIALPVANWWEATGLQARFESIRKGISDWWTTKGGVSGILTTIREGWAGKLASVKAWWEGSLLKAGFEGIAKGISTWWEGLGAEEGTLGKIRAGWHRYIAKPLENFWGQHLAAPFETIHSGLLTWWQDQTKEAGVLGAIKAGWQEYIADPLIGFWIESGLSQHFATFTTKLTEWWEAVKKSAGEALERLRELRAAEGVAPVVAEPRTGILGVYDAVRNWAIWEKFGKVLQTHVIDRFLAWKDLASALLKLIQAINNITWDIIIGGLLTVIEKFGGADNEGQTLLDTIKDQFWWVGELTDAIITFGEEANTVIMGIAREMRRLTDRINELDGALRRIATGELNVSAAVGRALDRAAARLPVVGDTRGPGYQFGGIVPGPIGVPRLATVHGGEVITPPGRGRQRRAGVHIDFRGAHFYGIDETMVEELFEEERIMRALRGIKRSEY